MAKKIKSFTVEEEAYNALMALFKEAKTEASVSSYLESYIKELFAYFDAIRQELKNSESYTVPLSFVIESFLKEPKIRAFSSEPLPGEAKSFLQAEIEGWQEKYNEEQRKKISLELDPEVYEKLLGAAGKDYGTPQVINFLFKVLLKHAQMGRDLTDEEYKEIEASMGPGFRDYRLDKVKPKFDKIDDRLDKVLKAFGLKVDR